MGLVVRKPVCRVSDKASFKQVSSATETRQNIEISPVAILHMILSKKRVTKALIRLGDAQAGLRLCCSQTPQDRFSRVEAHSYYHRSRFTQNFGLKLPISFNICFGCSKEPSR